MVRRNEALNKVCRHICVGSAPAGNHNHVGRLEQVDPAIGKHPDASLSMQWTRLNGSTGKAIPAGPHPRARKPEYLGSDPALESAQPVVNQHHDARASMRNSVAAND